MADFSGRLLLTLEPVLAGVSLQAEPQAVACFQVVYLGHDPRRSGGEAGGGAVRTRVRGGLGHGGRPLQGLPRGWGAASLNGPPTEKQGSFCHRSCPCWSRVAP